MKGTKGRAGGKEEGEKGKEEGEESGSEKGLRERDQRERITVGEKTRKER